MSSLATTDGENRITNLRLNVPPQGAWRCDAVLEGGPVPVAGSPVTLTVGDLTLVGFVLRADLDAPGKPHAVLVGSPGWERPITKPLSYDSDAGVRLSSVLRDLAKRAGEPIEQPTDRDVGPLLGFAAGRPGEPFLLRDALATLARSGYLGTWRVDPDGVTRFGPRSGVPVTARATELRRASGVGVTTYGIDSPAAFLPGNLIDGVPISRLIVVESSGKLEAEIQTQAVGSIMTTILRKVAEWFPQLFYGYARTYVVDSVRGDGRLNLVPRADAPYLAELSAVDQWVLGGGYASPSPGAEVTVMFRDANPTRAIVVAFAPGTPTALRIGAAATAAAARVGDAVDCGQLFFVVTPPSLYYAPPGLVPTYAPVVSDPTTPPAPGTPGTPVTGEIAEGSAITAIE